MKKALIFDAFDDYEIRIRFIKSAMERAGYEVKIFFADFDHYTKEYIKKKRTDVYYIHTKPYKKNLSFARIYSHILFSKACLKIAEEQKGVSLVYVMSPPNLLVKEFSKYKQKHPNVNLWIDVCDLWPESLPVPKILKKMTFPFLNVWRNFRDNYLNVADLITLECNLFYEKLNHFADVNKFQTLYLCQPAQSAYHQSTKEDKLGILYCGSINHIIDIDLMILFMKKINEKKKVVLHIIGDGENKGAFIQKAEKNMIPYIFHGRQYDVKKKQMIYSVCQFGFNIMKNSVFVGLTMKSLDYMSYGLPLISNIQGDTYHFVEERKIGYNLCLETVDQIINQILEMNVEDYQNMRFRTEKLFAEQFSEETAALRLEWILKKL